MPVREITVRIKNNGDFHSGDFGRYKLLTETHAVLSVRLPDNPRNGKARVTLMPYGEYQANRAGAQVKVMLGEMDELTQRPLDFHP